MQILLRAAIALVITNKDSILAAKDFASLVTAFQKATIGDKAQQCHEFVTVRRFCANYC